MRIKNRIIIAISAILVAGSISVTSYALTTQEKLNQAQQQKKETESQLKNKKEDITGLQSEQNSLKKTLNNLNEQLEEVGNNLVELEKKIEAKQTEIDETKAALEEAKQVAANQYAAMKKRVQYMYEGGTFSIVDVFLNSGSLADTLNYYDYMSEINNYDTNMLKNYKAICAEVTRQEEQLEVEMAELAEYKVQVEAEQSRVSGLVSSTSNSISQYAGQISQAEAEAAAYEQKIKEQEADIAALKKKLAEEIAMSKLAARSHKRDISQVTFGEEDRYLLANLIYCEAGGEPYAGKLAVGSVVVNRLLSSVYPDSMTGVIYQRGQFSPVSSGRYAVALAENRANSACYQAADEAMAGVSNVGDCVYFRTPIPGLTGISIGGHIFY